MSHAIDIKTKLWTKRFRDFEGSSLTVDQFCKSVGCSAPTFYFWKRKLSESSPASATRSDSTLLPNPAPHSAFLQVQTKADCSIQVKLLSGVVIAIPVEAIDWLPQVLDRIA